MVHLTTLDLAVATGSLSLPKWNSPDAWVVQQRGITHETAYIQHLQSQGFSVVNLQDAGGEKAAFEMTCAAMQSGVDVIVQAVLSQGGNWFGRADVLTVTFTVAPRWSAWRPFEVPKQGNPSYHSFARSALLRWSESGQYDRTTSQNLDE